MKKVLLTGASGFIGRHLVRHLQSLGYQTVAVSSRPHEIQNCPVIVGSFLDQIFLTQAFAEIAPDYVIHLASKVSPGRDSSDLKPQLENTVQPSLNVANALPSSVKLAVFFGSCEEYGNSKPPFTEEMPLVAFSPYGWGKISAHYGTMLISRLKKLPVCWVRPFLTYGPDQHQDLLIPALIRGCLFDQKIPLTPGGQTREFVYVKDLCVMIEKLLTSPEKVAGQVLNLCTGEERTVRSVAEAIQKIVGKGQLDFGALPYRENEAMNFYGSPNKFNKLFGVVKLTPFEQAIRETLESYRT